MFQWILYTRNKKKIDHRQDIYIHKGINLTFLIIIDDDQKKWLSFDTWKYVNISLANNQATTTEKVSSKVKWRIIEKEEWKTLLILDNQYYIFDDLRFYLLIIIMLLVLRQRPKGRMTHQFYFFQYCFAIFNNTPNTR